MVSTVAAGDIRRYVGATDVTMMYSVADIAGIKVRSSSAATRTWPASPNSSAAIMCA